MKQFTLISLVPALLLSGCLESNPQPSPGTQDAGNWSFPFLDVTDRAQDIPLLGETAVSGKDCVSGCDLSAPADTAADGTPVDVFLDTMDVVDDIPNQDMVEVPHDIPGQEVIKIDTSPSCGPCDDGDPCNGVETCDPVTSTCVPETIPACPAAPPECNQTGGVGAPQTGMLLEAEAGGFRLYDENGWGTANAVLDALAQHASVVPMTLDTVLDDLNRTGTKLTYMSGVPCFHTGFEWNSGDDGVDYWYPQGLTSTATAYADGSYAGRKVAVVSWYHKPEEDSAGSPNKGARVSITDVTSMNDISYRLALLVEPYWSGATPNFKAVPVHAGGIAWYRDFLFVADTSEGFRVFDMTRILQVQTGQKDIIGLVSGAYHAHGYKYVIPQVTRYRLCPSSCCARFSFVALDLSTDPIALVAGEYSKDSIAGRLHRWPLDAATGHLIKQGGAVIPTQALFPGVKKMQGGLTWDDHVFISSSYSNGTLYDGTLGMALDSRNWPYVPEDLHYSMFSDNLWCHTELPDDRQVFAVKKDDILADCN